LTPQPPRGNIAAPLQHQHKTEEKVMQALKRQLAQGGDGGSQ